MIINMVSGGFTAKVVGRYLRSRRGFTAVVTAFSVLGITLGVAALIIVLAVMSGFRQELMSRILGITGHATVAVAMQLPQAEKLATAVKAMPGVLSAAPYVSGQVMLSANGKAGGAFIRGIEPQDLPEQLKQPGRLVLDTGSTALAPGTVLVGSALARQLGLLPGSGVQVISPQGAQTPFGFIPRVAQMKVGGIFNIGMVQFDQGLVLTSLDDLQKFLGMHGEVEAVEVRVAEPTRIYDYIGPIQEAMLKVGVEPLDVTRITTWQDTNADFFRALQVERVTMFIILSLIVLVAAFNVITGQMMLVNDKMQDIAILRTMGATRRQILRVFFLNGMLLGGVGTLAGIGTGMLVVWRMQQIVDFVQGVTGVNLFPGDVYFLSELPARIDWSDVRSIVAMALGLTLLASLYPAWKASRMDPVALLKRG